MVIHQGDIVWADLDEPRGSEPVYKRPVIIVQADGFNRSRIDTVVCVPLTSNLKRADSPGNVLLSPRATKLQKESVANVSLVTAVDRDILGARIGRLSTTDLAQVIDGVELVLGR
jgi:mRNA interferase MazF